MASSSTSPEAGFATPAAVVISLAMATVAIAVQARAIATLHASQGDYVRSVAEARLSGVQQIAAAALYSGAGLPGSGARVTLGDADSEIDAEPEAAKLGLRAGAGLDASALSALGASEPERVRSGLSRLAVQGDGDPDDLRALDPSPLWKRCAPRTLSAYGQAQAVTGNSPPNLTARTGEVWRILVRDRWGWTDDRTVRFTGDAASPARVIYRSFYRHRLGPASCTTFTVQAHAS